MCLSRKASVRLATSLPRLGSGVLRRDRDHIKTIVTKGVFSGMHADSIDCAAVQFSQLVLKNWLSENMVGKLKWHQSQGHRTGIVSASYGSYLRPIGESLGVDFVIASELEIDADRRATGRLLEGNCRGPEKSRRLHHWLRENHLDSVVLYAYGDSAGDREMLAMADHPHYLGKKTQS
jgi:phosphatidylglycerophosphatase C